MQCIAITEQHDSIFLLAPNLVGYVRVFLVLTASIVAFKQWEWMCVCYLLSQLLDIADGHIARKYNQAVLDQITDRLSTSTILLLDCIILPNFYLLFTLVLLLDLAGHWFHTFASCMVGAESHKQIPNTWKLLKLYYENKSLMFICHASNEFVWVSLFVLTRLKQQDQYSVLIPIIQTLLIPTTIFCILKNLGLGAKVLAVMSHEIRRQTAKKDR